MKLFVFFVICCGIASASNIRKEYKTAIDSFKKDVDETLAASVATIERKWCAFGSKLIEIVEDIQSHKKFNEVVLAAEIKLQFPIMANHLTQIFHAIHSRKVARHDRYMFDISKVEFDELEEISTSIESEANGLIEYIKGHASSDHSDLPDCDREIEINKRFLNLFLIMQNALFHFLGFDIDYLPELNDQITYYSEAMENIVEASAKLDRNNSLREIIVAFTEEFGQITEEIVSVAQLEHERSADSLVTYQNIHFLSIRLSDACNICN